MRTTITCQGMKNEETTEEDLDVMAAQEEAEALASLAAAHRTLRDARESQHQVRMSTRLLPSATWATRSHQRKAGTEMRHLQWSTLGLPASRKVREPLQEEVRKRQLTQRTANFSMAVHTESSMFEKGALETGWALIDGGTTRSRDRGRHWTDWHT